MQQNQKGGENKSLSGVAPESTDVAIVVVIIRFNCLDGPCGQIGPRLSRRSDRGVERSSAEHGGKS